MLQMKISTFYIQRVSLFSNFDDDFLNNHAFENYSFCIMQIGTIGNPVCPNDCRTFTVLIGAVR